jgi:WD40 repeat protein
MSKTVVINLGNGDLNNGFQRVTAQLWTAAHPHPEQFIGGLPPAPELVELYRNWQLIYRSLCDRKQLRSASLVEDDDELEIEEGSITNVSVIGFDDICQKLQDSLSDWLSSEAFFNIERQLRSALRTTDEIRVIIETNDEFLRRLPWHRCSFFRDYPKAEIALSRPEYKRRESSQLKVQKNQVRVLAVLGNSQGIDLAAETKFLQSLSDSEIVFLVNPTRAEFNTQLWNDAGWDILFFAGHSQTEGETGRIYINENPTNNSLTIEQLEEALKAAIDKGLKLAILNSCDGLGLASALEKLHIPTVIVMREPVPNRVAQNFFQHFLEAFALRRLSLYLSVQEARRKLQGLEDEFPGASWLPIICQNPATEAPTWLKLGGIPPCPYRGLFAFTESDAHLFFGREVFTADLVAAVQTKPMVAVVGPSGSGKSSVVFAGLVPSLRVRSQGKTPPIIISFRPGNNPFAALATAFAPFLPHLAEQELEIALREDNQALYKIIESLVQQNFGTRLVLIVDQFEELYTLALELERQPFLDALLFAVALAPAFTLVITLRADFYGHALSYRPFSDALQGAVHNLGPMSREELQSAIEQPAAQMQVQLEEGLTIRLINESWGNPGHLPLLEFALTQLWLKQTDGWLTHPAYNEIGGVESAVANHAETVYAQLSEADRLRAQRVFMQLVQPIAATDARRLATREEVKAENWDLVTQLASSRLVVTNRNETTGEETAEIVHEALIRSWGRLGCWMQCDGDFRRAQEHLRASIRQWESSAQDEGALLRGKPLTDAEYWLTQRQDELCPVEKSFIEQSLALREGENKKLKRRRQLTISGLTAGLVLALSLAGVAVWQGQSSAKSEIKAISATSEALFASHQELEALTEAIRAGEKLKKYPWLKKNTEHLVIQSLQTLLYRIKEYNRLQGHQGSVTTVAISPNHQIIVTAGEDGGVRLWKPNSKLDKILTGHRGVVNAVAFNHNGTLFATAGNDGSVRLWKPDGSLVRTLWGKQGAVNAVAFSPDGSAIATANGDKTKLQGTVQLWKLDGTSMKIFSGNIGVQTTVAFSPDGSAIASGGWYGWLNIWKTDGTLVLQKLAHDGGSINSLKFSPDGKTIATASSDRTVRLWKPDGTLVTTLDNHSAPVWGINYSRDGAILASASEDRTVKIWNRDGRLLTTLEGHKEKVNATAISPDGKNIATASAEGTVKLWKLGGTSLATLARHGSSVNAVAVSPVAEGYARRAIGEIIATASQDTSVKLWKRNGTFIKELLGHFAEVSALSFSPDGSTIVSASGDGIVKLWRRNGTPLKRLPWYKLTSVRAVAFSPDSSIIATASDDKTVKLWTRDGKLVKNLQGHTDAVFAVAFSPDGATIATSSKDKTVRLWRRDGRFLQEIKGHTGAVRAVAFSPDSSIIATASDDKTVKLWTRDGRFLQEIKGHTGAVRAVAFHPQGNILATAGDDKTIKIWQRESNGKFQPRLDKTLEGHQQRINALAFTPDGKTIISASNDQNAIFWDWQLDLNLDEALRRGCDWMRDYLQNNPNVSDSERRLCPRDT